MGYRPKPISMDGVIVVVVVMGRILDTIIIILLTPPKGKTHFSARSRIMVRQNKKMEKMYVKNPSMTLKETCYRCRMKGHWSRTYRTTKHLVDLYQTSLKDIGKRVETNFANGNGLDLSYFNMDFFEGPSDNFNCLIDDENVNIK